MIRRSRSSRNRTVRKSRVTRGADKGFDAEGFVLALQGRKVTPHIAINARDYCLIMGYSVVRVVTRKMAAL